MNYNKKGSNKCQLSKINLLSLLIDLLPIDNENLDIKLISNFSDINKILKLEKIDKFKFIYFNERIIDQILYDFEKFISIDEEYANYFHEFENWFYLDLLILSNPTIINYSLSKIFISKIDKNIIFSQHKLFLIFKSKIAIDSINNYKESDSYNESLDEKELDEIEKIVRKILKIILMNLKKSEFHLKKKIFIL